LLVVVASTQFAYAGCIDAAQLAKSTISITRNFDGRERAGAPGVVGVRGSAWFLSPTTIVTAEHVAAGMKLSTQEWKSLEIADDDGSVWIGARIKRVAGSQAEKLAIVELQGPVAAGRAATIRSEPLAMEEPVMTLVYPDGRARLVRGRFVKFGDGGALAGAALLEMYEGNDRLVIDHGASGAPVIDCQGRVAAVVSNVFTQSLAWGSRNIRVSTAWGMPNVVSIPVQALENMSAAD
jgi:hypothetical protein